MKKTPLVAALILAGTLTAVQAEPPHHGSSHNGPPPHGQAQNSNYHRYKAPKAYSRPSGYQSHRWNRGELLPSQYRRHRYRVDYQDYRLPPPARGQAWVRVDNDVALTVLETGLVVNIVHNLFY